MKVFCPDCNKSTTLNLTEWKCPSCGGAWEPASLPIFEPEKIKARDYSLWRYGEMLGLDLTSPISSMGVGWTPLVSLLLFGNKIHLKLEYLQPTGSFKDRGINTMVNQLVQMGVGKMVEDSSGNAGASLAAHGAHFGIPTEIFVPAYASRFKQHQISNYGVDLKRVSGTRKDTENAAQAAVGNGCTYASHAYHPAYLCGQITAAYEVWEQLGRKTPNWIICPVAQGGQFLGFWFGFTRLYKAGLIHHLPKMVAVQSARVAPLYHAWCQGLDDVPPIQPEGTTLAEGVAVTNPVRGKRLLQAVRESGGLVMAVEEDEIIAGQKLIAQNGYYIEPTSALVISGLKKLNGEINSEELIIAPLTGSGLKGEPRKNSE